MRTALPLCLAKRDNRGSSAPELSSGASVIFGFNTNVKYDSTVYHVQSEARQYERLLQTQVFVKGRCIGKRATSYADLTSGPDFSEEHMQDMLREQHKHFVTAVREGRIEAELAIHEREEDVAAAPFPESDAAATAAAPVAADEVEAPPPTPAPAIPVFPVVAPPPILEPSAAPMEVEVAAPPTDELTAEFAAAVASKPLDPGLILNPIGKVIGKGLSLECMPPALASDGSGITVCVRVADESGPAAGAQVSCRISAGKAAGRYVYVTSGADGVADLEINLNGLEPTSTALLIQASHRGKSTSRKFQLARS